MDALRLACEFIHWHLETCPAFQPDLAWDCDKRRVDGICHSVSCWVSHFQAKEAESK